MRNSLNVLTMNLARRFISTNAHSATISSLHRHIIAKNLYYPTSPQKQKLALQYAIAPHELNDLLVQWRRERRHNGRNKSNNGNAVQVLRQWVHENRDEAQSVALKVPSSDSFRHLMGITGLDVSQLRKCLAYVLQTQHEITSEARDEVVQTIQQRNEDGFAKLAEEDYTALKESTGLSRLQIRGILRVYRLSKHPITRHKIATLREAWDVFCRSHPSRDQQLQYLHSFVQQIKPQINLTTKQIKRIVQRFTRASIDTSLQKDLNRVLIENASNGCDMLTSDDIVSISQKLGIDDELIWRLIRRRTYFPLTTEKKEAVLKEVESSSGPLTRDQIRSLSRRLCLSSKQIRYLLITHKQKQQHTDRECNPHIINEWFAKHQRRPSKEEFAQLVADSLLTPRQVSDVLHRLRNPPKHVTPEALALIEAYSHEHKTRRLSRREKSPHIDLLSAETGLTRKQVAHFLSKFEDPPGDITPERRQFVIEHYAGSKHSLVQCQSETQLSRKQIHEIVRRHKRSTPNSEPKKYS